LYRKQQYSKLLGSLLCAMILGFEKYFSFHAYKAQLAIT
jgi:hypothetical protein